MKCDACLRNVSLLRRALSLIEHQDLVRDISRDFDSAYYIGQALRIAQFVSDCKTAILESEQPDE
jgi:hypothetical protein